MRAVYEVSREKHMRKRQIAPPGIYVRSSQSALLEEMNDKTYLLPSLV